MRPGGRPLLHTQTFTLIIPGTQTALRVQTHTVSLTHTPMLIYTLMLCDTNAGGHKLVFFFLPHQVWKYMPLDYNCNFMQSPHLRSLPGLLYISL